MASSPETACTLTLTQRLPLNLCSSLLTILEISCPKPMTIDALNDKLAHLCRCIGLTRRHTYHSFRRTAIIQTRRAAEDEMARNLAFHVPGSATLLAYDNIGMSDLNLTAFRLGEKEGMSRKDVTAFFSQAQQATVTGNDTDDFMSVLREGVNGRLTSDPEYIEMEGELMQMYDLIHTALVDLKTRGILMQKGRFRQGTVRTKQKST